jgi:hypothetical protein
MIAGPDANEFIPPMSSQACVLSMRLSHLEIASRLQTFLSGTASSNGSHTSRTPSAMGQHF